MSEDLATSRPQLNICVTCTHHDGAASGQALYDAVIAMNDGRVDVFGVHCLATCQNRCSATLSMPGKWGWLMGHLHAGLTEDLLTYISAYKQSVRGVVLPSKRPANLEKVMLGRFPAFKQRDLV